MEILVNFNSIKRYSTSLEFNNLKNSLKSGGSRIVAIDNLPINSRASNRSNGVWIAHTPSRQARRKGAHTEGASIKNEPSSRRLH